MPKTKLIIDSNCNLEDGLTEKLGAEVVPFNALVNGKEYKDGIDIDAEAVYKISATKGAPLPKTAAINTEDLEEAFKTALAGHDRAVFITISSALSSSYGNALSAIKSLGVADRVVAIDSRSLSCGIAILAERAHEDIAKGLDLAAIKADLDDVASRTTVEFVIDKMDNLYKGGRCTGLTFILGKAFHIHPIIGMTPDGKLLPIHIARGKDIGKGVETIVADLKADLDRDNVDCALPVYCTDAKAQDWNDKARDQVHALVKTRATIRQSRASTVIAIHCGPGTFGIGWTRKKAPKAK